ncbi:MAG TPA: hypothetical protein DGN60_02610 [Chloroflexi bacterium]|nr:hypothetical protein [Chloroflexota bacterium]
MAMPLFFSKMTRRNLYSWEQQEAETVFSASIEYQRVIVHEGVRWTNVVDDWSRRMRFVPARPQNQQNAIAIGFHCYFPICLPTICLSGNNEFRLSMGWLIHELVHVWQFQSMGWNYLPRALMTHIREGDDVYNYGGQANLEKSRSDGIRLKDYNLEQQAAIIQDAYLNRSDVYCDSVWDAFIADVS